MVRPAIIVLSPSGLETARRIAHAIDAEIHGLARRVESVDIAFDSVIEHIVSLFDEGRPVVGICAAGILVRAVAPRLSDKTVEPPVLAVADDGSAVVPILGGHHGANDLARQIATLLGVAPAVTTAGDLRFGAVLDMPPEGWTLANPEHAKEVMARLVAGAEARIEGEMPWLRESGLLSADGSGASPTPPVRLTATEGILTGGPGHLVYHPQTLALGVGCERGCDPGELIGLVESALAGAGLAPASIALVASIDVKADERAVHALAAQLGVPARFFDAAALDAETPRLQNPSETVRREVGCPGVAEGAALAASGPDGELVVAKTKSKRATCAVARGPTPIPARTVGRARGRLSVIGIGPGAADWRSPEATHLLREATDWIGYRLYLDLAADLSRNKTWHEYALGEEELRVRKALELAGTGRDVALVCSGDAGIYAMAALVFEVLDYMEPNAAARRAEIIVAPGISAFQAAAARAGAIVGHDFCTISLSDLLTPWPVIEARIRAAADGDFVVAFYNPRSRNRQDHLVRALAILGKQRPPATPVIVASNLGRPNEDISVHALGEFDPTIVDMLTIVLVGASTSRRLETADGKVWAYTPRGYAAKRRAAE